MNLRTARRRFRDPPGLHAPWLGWAWNGRLDDNRLEEQIDAVVAASFGGVAIYPHEGLLSGIHSSPGWFEHVAAVAKRVRRKTLSIHVRESLEGTFAAVDESLCQDHPEACLNEIVLEQLVDCRDRIDPAGFGQPGEPVAAFIVANSCPAAAHRIDALGSLMEPQRVERVTCPTDAAGRTTLLFRTRIIPNRLNYLDRRAAELFLQTVPQHLATHAKRYLGHPVTGLYIDGIGLRLTPGALPWDPELDTLFRETRGYSLIDVLPSLFYNVPGYACVRYDYWTIINDMLREGLATPIKEWCAEHRLRFGVSLRPLDRRTPALLESALLPVERVSDDFVLRIPYDVADRGFQNPAAFGEWLVAVKRVCSSCEQLGPPRQAAISIGCETSRLELERAGALGLWLQACGAQTVIFERLAYRPTAEAEPVELNDQEPFWPALKALNTTLARVSGMMRYGHRRTDVAVLYPSASVQSLYAHPIRAAEQPSAVSPDRLILDHLARLAVALHEAGADFEFVDELTLVEAGTAERRTLAVGPERYRVLVVPPCVNLRAQTIDVLHDFLSGGGMLAFAGSVPYLVDGEPSETLVRLVEEYGLLLPNRGELLDYGPMVEFLRARRIIPALDDDSPSPALACRRSDEHAELVLAFNPSNEPRDLSVRISTPFDGHVESWDPRTGEMHGVGGCDASEALTISDRWNPYEARVYVAVDTAFRESTSGVPVERRPGPIPLWTVARAAPATLEFGHCWLEGDAPPYDPRSIEDVRAVLSDAIAEVGRPAMWKTRFRFSVVSGSGDELACRILVPVTDPDPVADLEVSLDGRALTGPTPLSFRGRFCQAYPIPELDVGIHEVEWASTYRIPDDFISPVIVGEFKMTSDESSLPAIEHGGKQIGFGLWSEYGLSGFAGPVVYRGTWTLLDISKAERVILSLPEIEGVATVRVNGNNAGVFLWRPFECDITRLLRRGENQVEINLSAAPGGSSAALGLVEPPLIHVDQPRTNIAS